MRYHVLAADYDGTLAHDGLVDPATVEALRRVRASGRKLLLVTGRQLDDLQAVFPAHDVFDLIVAENGALVFNTATRATRLLADPPPDAFAALLRRRGVQPLAMGKVIVATWRPHENEVLEAIRHLGLELQVIFNKGAVMVLPSGINKAVGLAAALGDLGLTAHETVGVGDAENDHAFLSECECAVAVANALPLLKARADVVMDGVAGAGVRALCDALIEHDLANLAPTIARHQLVLGKTVPAGSAVEVAPYGQSLLIAGTSGSGKSTLATAFLEALTGHGYAWCVIDPEGDYSGLHGAAVLGTPDHPPGVDELCTVLDRPGPGVVANLMNVRVDERPAFFDRLLPRLIEARARTARPHWVLIDEAHHLMPRGWQPPAAGPDSLRNLAFVTVHPEHVSASVLQAVGLVVAIGAEPAQTLNAFAAAVNQPPPTVTPGVLPAGEGWAWWPGRDAPPIHFVAETTHAERRRHVRKYAAGQLGEDKSFYFRGPDGRLNLRAQNLQIFLQVADGVDDATWLYHLRRGDYSGWFREAIKDTALADEAAAVETAGGQDAAATRAAIRAAVQARYTAPA